LWNDIQILLKNGNFEIGSEFPSGEKVFHLKFDGKKSVACADKPEGLEPVKT